MKEWNIPNHENGFYSLTSDWIKGTSEWIKSKIPFKFPDTITSIEIMKKDNILEGNTKIMKKHDTLVAKVVIHVSQNVLRKKNILQGIKIVMIHEFCHIVNPFNPDIVMRTYFPKVWQIWEKVMKAKALKCSAEIKQIK